MGRVKFGWLFLVVFWWSSAAAVEWTVTPSITIAETYTDNLYLAPDELPGPAGLSDPRNIKDDEFITEILPAIKIGVTGKRFEIDFDYRLQTMLYSRQDDLDETLNYSGTSGTAKLIGESVFVTFNGSLNQQIVSTGGRIGVSGISPGNRSEVGYFSVSPYWQKQFGGAGNIRVAYQYGLVEYDQVTVNDPLAMLGFGTTLKDSESNGVTATISGAPQSVPWSWRADVTDSTIDYDDGSSVDLARIGGEFAWSFGKTAIFVSGGDENNEFSQQLPGIPKIDGAYWNVGLRGQLDRLTTYSISAGEQHFGNSYQFSLVRQAGLLTTNISYLEETTTVGQQQQGYEALFQFLSNISGAELPTPGAEVYVRKRLSAVGSLQLPRSRLQLNAYNEDRNYLTATPGLLGSDGILGVALSWTWTALPRTEFSIDAGWQAFELRTSFDNPEDTRLQLRIKRDMKKGVFLNVRAWRNSRAGSRPDNEYEANAVSIGFGKEF